MTDSQDVERLLAAIDHDPDQLHLDRTPAVSALAELGWRAAPGLLDLMATAEAPTRLRAATALELIVDREHGFVAGQGFPSPEAEDAVRVLWAANGGYRHDADESARAESVRRWREWLTRRSEAGAEAAGAEEGER
ncbi:hypothetical protein ABZ468_37410 [Streptomyces sp. NPDC005708]|uniref:hypothetical protein n=1 Tax=unclassified Streptomyces TaxID=2593676 RepID=UPI00340A61C7